MKIKLLHWVLQKLIISILESQQLGVTNITFQLKKSSTKV